MSVLLSRGVTIDLLHYFMESLQCLVSNLNILFLLLVDNTEIQFAKNCFHEMILPLSNEENVNYD